jgi:hypothetical protein
MPSGSLGVKLMRRSSVKAKALAAAGIEMRRRATQRLSLLRSGVFDWMVRLLISIEDP